VRHWLRVYELLEDVPDSEESLELAVEARGALLSISILGSVEAPVDPDRLIEECHEIASRGGSARVRTRMLGACGMAQLLRGNTADALEMLSEGVRIAGETGDEALADLLPFLSVTLAEARGPLASIAIFGQFQGRFGESPQLGKGLTGLAPQAAGLSYRGLWMAWAGRIVEGRVSLERGLEMTREQGDPAAVNMALSNATFFEVESGNGAEAVACARRGAEIGIDLQGRVALAIAYACEERWSEAEAEFAANWAALSPGMRRSFLPWRASGLHALGEEESAITQLRDARADAQNAGATMTDLRITLLLARLLARSEGAAAQAEIEQALGRAAELIESTGARLYRAQLHAERAELMQALGDDKSRREELAEAQRLYAEMGAEGHAQRLARELAL
jgi:tetratricopeptide (TPR) repeat protein